MTGKNNKGFTLIEMLVAMGIFSLVIIAVTAVFSMVLISQRQIIVLKHIQEESVYIMEFLQKEARMAQYGNVCAGDGVLYNISNGQLKFKNSKAVCVTYNLSGNTLQRNNLAMNSSKTKISNLSFSNINNLLNYSFDISDHNNKSTININSNVSPRAF